MVARITAAQAKKLGIDPKVGRTRTTRRVAKGGTYHTQCVHCLEEFTTQTSETRHVEATHHARYRLL